MQRIGMLSDQGGVSASSPQPCTYDTSPATLSGPSFTYPVPGPQNQYTSYGNEFMLGSGGRPYTMPSFRAPDYAARSGADKSHDGSGSKRNSISASIPRSAATSFSLHTHESRQPDPSPSPRSKPAPSRTSQRRKASSRDPIPAARSDGAATNTAKRSKFLERNRVAASKCREKKKVWLHELEETKLELEARHRVLRTEYEGLMDQMTRMKNALVSHASCNDPGIDNWIQDEARKFVKRAAERPMSPVRRDSSRDFDAMSGISPFASAGEGSYHNRSIDYDHMPDVADD